jgi:fucose permease
MMKNKQRLMILAFTIMMMNGIVNNLRAQVGPYIIEDYSLNYSRLGILLSFISIGAMILYFLSGKLIEKFGLIKLIFYGVIYNIAALLAIYFSKNYYTLTAAFFVLGSGLTLLNIVSVNLISISYSKNRGKMINLLHLFYGLGGIIAPYFVTLVIKIGFSWAHSFLFSIILLVIIFIEFKTATVPQVSASKDQTMKKTGELLKDIKVILFSLIVFLQIGVEFSIVTWLAPFLKDVEGRTELEISFYIALFFITFTIGRLLASFLVEKVGYFNFIIYTAGAAALSICIALIGGRNFTIFIPLSGIFLAAQVPTAQAAILDSFDNSGIKVVGFAQTAGMFGSTVLASWIIGFVNDFISLKAGFVILIISLLTASIITYYLKLIFEKETI